MEDKHVELFATLLGKGKDVVEGALDKEGGLSGLVKLHQDSKEGRKVFNSQEDLNTLLENTKKEYLTTVISDENNIPSELYNPIKRNVLSKFDKQVISETGFQGDYTDSLDLVRKAYKKNSGEGESELLQKKEGRIQELEEALQTIKSDGDKRLEEVTKNHHRRLAERDMNDIASKLKVKLANQDKAEKQMEVATGMFFRRYDISVEDGKTVVIDKSNNEVVKNDLRNPRELSEVLEEVASEYLDFKVVPPGGRGEPNRNENVNAGTPISFIEYAESKKVKPNTAEADKLYKEWKERTPA